MSFCIIEALMCLCISDAIKPIVQLLNSEGSELRMAAAEALSSLTNDNILNA